MVKKKTRLSKANCTICAEEFYYYASSASGRYCSQACCTKDRSRFTKELIKSGRFKPSLPNPGWSKGLKRPELSGENHYNWKGDQVGYAGLHDWIKNRLIKPQTCRDCNQPKPLDLANISGKYLREVSDWEWLCRSCHMKKDGRLKALQEKHQEKIIEIGKKISESKRKKARDW